MNKLEKLSNNKIYNIAFIVLVVVCSVLAFLLVPVKDKYFWTSYIFTLNAFLGVFGSGYIIIKGKLKNYITNAVLIPVAIKYLIAELFITVAFYGFIRIKFVYYICLHIGLFAFFIIKFLILLMGRNTVVNLSTTTKEKVNSLKLQVSDVDVIIDSLENLNSDIKNKLHSLLTELREKIRYSDPMTNESLNTINNQININILKLQDLISKQQLENSEDIVNTENLIYTTINLINERNRKVQILK